MLAFATHKALVNVFHDKHGFHRKPMQNLVADHIGSDSTGLLYPLFASDDALPHDALLSESRRCAINNRSFEMISVSTAAALLDKRLQLRTSEKISTVQSLSIVKIDRSAIYRWPQYMLRATDLIRLAELIKLSAETAKAFDSTYLNGDGNKIADAAARIYAAADELAAVGREIEGRSSESA